MQIVSATQPDIPGIQHVASESWRATYAHIFSSEFIDQWLAGAYSAESLRNAISNPDSIFLVAKEETQVTGFLQLGMGGHGRYGDGAVLYRIYLLPTHWGRGIGGELLGRAEEWLRERGESSYFCFVHSQNEVGKAFYLKQGFVHQPEQDHEDEWYMEKRL